MGKLRALHIKRVVSVLVLSFLLLVLVVFILWPRPDQLKSAQNHGVGLDMKVQDSAESASLQVSPAKVPYNNSTNSFWSSAIKWLLYNIPAWVAFLVLHNLYLSKKRQRKKLIDLEEEILYMKQFKQKPQSFPHSQNTDYIEKKRYNTDRQEIQNKLFELEHIIGELKEKTSLTEQKPLDKSEDGKPIDSNIQYYPPPLQGGIFPLQQGNLSFDASKSFYELTIDDNNTNMATYRFYNSDADAVKRAISYSNAIIEVACELDNFPSSSSKSVKTLFPGTAIKQEKGWVIRKKALISYE